MPILSARFVDKPALSWRVWCNWLGVPQAVSRRTWHALTKSRHPSYTLLAFQLGQIVEAPTDQVRKERMLRLHHDGALKPTVLVPLLESLHAVGWLDAGDLKTMVNAIVQETNSTGDWWWLAAITQKETV